MKVQYKKVVDAAGNARARRYWSAFIARAIRSGAGLAMIPDSGYLLKDEYAEFDAFAHFGLEPLPRARGRAAAAAKCLQGKIAPFACPLFGKGCTPEHPIGPCMVSSEGTCGAYYRYNRKKV